MVKHFWLMKFHIRKYDEDFISHDEKFSCLMVKKHHET